MTWLPARSRRVLNLNMTSKDEQYKGRTIALIGLRGCGKSVVARELVKLLRGDHVDTDEVIAARAGKSIAAVFADADEAVFRQLEQAVIAEVVHRPPSVISIGGGAILDRQNVDNLKAVATLVWLTAPVEVLWRRISADPATANTRPPLTDRTGTAELEHLLAERSNLYEQASDLTIDTSQRTPLEVAKAIAEALYGNPYR